METNSERLARLRGYVDGHAVSQNCLDTWLKKYDLVWLCDQAEGRAKAERLLEDLTPGGSEFVGNPKRCAEYLRQELSAGLKAHGDLGVARNKAYAALADLRREFGAVVRALSDLRRQYLREAAAVGRWLRAKGDGEVLDADDALALPQAQAVLKEKKSG